VTVSTIDLARFNGNAVATLSSASDALARLGEWVTAAQHAHALVAPLIGTAFVPDAYKPKVDPRATEKERAAAYEVAVANATAAVLQGITLGLDPMTALQQIYIVHGRPGMYAKLMVALIQAHGHEVWTEDLSDTRAVVCGRRKGSEYTERITITMDMARKAKWTSNAKYQETPQDMLWARAAGRVCDRIASDVLKGIASVEEIRDEVQATAEVGTRTVSPRRRAAAIEATTVEDPPLDEPVPTAERVAAPAAPMTKVQSGKMFALLAEHGYSDKDAALAFIAITIGREIASSAELTKAEAAAVIDKLGALNEPPLDEGDWPATAEPAADPELAP
jgi:hypothetical protein